MEIPDFIKTVLVKYPNVKISEDKELASEAIESISLSEGKCPCNSKVTCPCSSVVKVHSGINQECNCGLFVKVTDDNDV